MQLIFIQMLYHNSENNELNYMSKSKVIHCQRVDPKSDTRQIFSSQGDTVNEKFKLTYKTLWTLLSYLHAKCPWSV